MLTFSISIFEQHVSIWVGLVSSVTAIFVAVKKLNTKADQIHVLVNSNLQRALMEIEDLKSQVLALKEKNGNEHTTETSEGTGESTTP